MIVAIVDVIEFFGQLFVYEDQRMSQIMSWCSSCAPYGALKISSSRMVQDVESSEGKRLR